MKMHYFFYKSSSLLPGIDQTNQVCSNGDQERIYQNCLFHDPWGIEVLMLGRDHISHSEFVLSSTLSIYSTLIAIVKGL